MLRILKTLARDIWTAQPHKLPVLFGRYGAFNGPGHTYAGDRTMSPQLAKLAKHPVATPESHRYSG